MSWRSVARQNNINISTYESRVDSGWSEEEAATIPVDTRFSRLDEEKKYWIQVAESNAISHQLFNIRKKRGLSNEEAATRPKERVHANKV